MNMRVALIAFILLLSFSRLCSAIIFRSLESQFKLINEDTCLIEGLTFESFIKEEVQSWFSQDQLPDESTLSAMHLSDIDFYLYYKPVQ